MNSNPFARVVLGGLNLDEDRLKVAKRAAHDLIRERAAGSDQAVLDQSDQHRHRHEVRRHRRT